MTESSAHDRMNMSLSDVGCSRTRVGGGQKAKADSLLLRCLVYVHVVDAGA